MTVTPGAVVGGMAFLDVGAPLSWHDLRRTSEPMTTSAPTDDRCDATEVELVVGGHAFGRVVADRCDRPLRIAAIAGCDAYRRLTPEDAATVVLDVDGPLWVVPRATRVGVLVTGDVSDGASVERFVRRIERHVDDVRIIPSATAPASSPYVVDAPPRQPRKAGR